MYKKILYSAIFCLFILLNQLFPEDSLLNNSGFEDGSSAIPDYWTTDSWIKDAATTEFQWVTEAAFSGKRCMLIKNHKLNDARLIQSVILEEGKLYKFSCKLKTENISKEGRGANLSIIGTQHTSTGIHGTHDWEDQTLYIMNQTYNTHFQLSLGIGGYSAISSGFAWFDDVLLTVVSTLPANAQMVSLTNTQDNTSQTDTDKNKMKIETRGSYWAITILMLVAGIAVLMLIIFRIKKEDRVPDKNQVESTDSVESTSQIQDEKKEITD